MKKENYWCKKQRMALKARENSRSLNRWISRSGKGSWVPLQQAVRFRNNNLQFYFIAINLRGSRNIRYRYRLEGYDSKWQEGTDIRQARYSILPPGDYTFKVKASADRKNWVDATESFQFSIVAPVYMRWWFKILVALLAAFSMY